MSPEAGHIPNGPPSTVDVIVQIPYGKVALIKRKHDPFKGKWALPGGFIENTETPYEAAVREIQEEIGVTLTFDDIHFLHFYADRKADTRAEVIISFVFKAYIPKEDLEVVAGSDATEVAWISLGKLREMVMHDDLAFSHGRMISDAMGWTRGAQGVSKSTND